MAKRIAFYGIFGALAIIIAYIERLFPPPIPLPGIKLGLANVIVIMMLYAYNTRAAFSVAVLRIVIVGLLFGNPFSIAYSLAGGLTSFVAMLIAKRSNIFGVVGVSVFGGVFHNIAQIAIAAIIVQDIRLFTYSPVMILAGIATGVLIGFTAGFTLVNLKTINTFGKK